MTTAPDQPRMKTKSELPDLRALDCDGDEFLSLCLAQRLGVLRIPGVAQSKEPGKIWKVTVERGEL